MTACWPSSLSSPPLPFCVFLLPSPSFFSPSWGRCVPPHVSLSGFQTASSFNFFFLPPGDKALSCRLCNTGLSLRCFFLPPPQSLSSVLSATFSPPDGFSPPGEPSSRDNGGSLSNGYSNFITPFPHSLFCSACETKCLAQAPHQPDP